MTHFLRLLFVVFSTSLLIFSSCQEQPTITTDTDLTINIIGGHVGNYVVNYEASPQNNTSSQISISVTRVTNTTIRIDAQGGDSFECSVSGSTTALTLSNITNTKGAFVYGTKLEGAYANSRIYFKITGDRYGGPFVAEFTAI